MWCGFCIVGMKMFSQQPILDKIIRPPRQTEKLQQDSVPNRLCWDQIGYTSFVPVSCDLLVTVQVFTFSTVLPDLGQSKVPLRLGF